MKFGSLLMTLLFLGALSASALIVGCEDEGFEFFDDVPLMADDGNNYAKDMDEEGRCDVDDYFIEDCHDACTCCYYGSTDMIGGCIQTCDTVLLSYQDYPADQTDIQNFKECVVGCFSVCEIEDKGESCWNQCKQYVEGA